MSYDAKVDAEKREEAFSLKTDERPAWLECGFNDAVWVFSDSLPGRVPSSSRMNWHSGAPLGQIDDDYVRFLQEAKEVVAYYANGLSRGQPRSSSIHQFSLDVRSLFRWLFFHRNIGEIRSVSESDIRCYERYISSLGVSRSRVFAKLFPWTVVWKWSVRRGFGLKVRPYQDFRELRLISKRIGSPDGHTETISPDQLFFLVDASLYVVKEAHAILNSSSLDSQTFNHVNEKSLKEQGLLGSADGDMIVYGACVVLLLSLTGQRIHELLGCRYGDVAGLIDGTLPYLASFERKTSGSSAGRQTKRPLVKEGIMAFEVLKALIWPSSSCLQEEPFFSYPKRSRNQHCIKSQGMAIPSIYRRMDAFCNFFGFHSKVRPHMLRRAFSLMWMWRFEVGALRELSALLRHNSVEFTKIYVEDVDAIRFMPDGQRALISSVMFDALLEPSSVAGGFRESIRRYRRVLEARVEVLDARAIADFADEIVSKVGLTIVPNADGYCFISPGRSRYSKCSSDGCAPDYSNRSEWTCGTCANFLTTPSRRDYWQARLIAHEEVASHAKSEMLRSAAKAGIDLAKRHLIPGAAGGGS